MSRNIHWLKAPEEHDYPAALSYLSLVYPEVDAGVLVDRLRRARVKKIRDGKKLSPLLLVRDKAHGRVVIADGYHRLCAVYSFDEDAEIPCKIV